MSLEGSNPSPSAYNPNRPQRCGIKQERGGHQARLSHRLKPLRTAMDCRATVAQRRRVPSKAEECVRVATSGERLVDANGRVLTPHAASGDGTLAPASGL